jgi:hypothetical protein
MDNNPIHNIPDETKIEEMLSQFTPQPTPRFYNMMSAAPWQRRTSFGVPRTSINMKLGLKLFWGLAVLGIVLAIAVIIFIPSVRVTANQIIHLFLPASSNQLDVQVALTSLGDLVDFSDPANFPFSVKEVQQIADFEVKEVSILPIGLTFIGSRYDPSYNAVTLLYAASDYKLFLTQRPIGNGDDVFSIGASAIVSNVKVGSNQAEFVMGGWKAVSTQPAPVNQTPAGSVNIIAIWDNNLAQSILRWRASDIVYELRTNGEGGPTQSELLNLANGLK